RRSTYLTCAVVSTVLLWCDACARHEPVSTASQQTSKPVASSAPTAPPMTATPPATATTNSEVTELDGWGAVTFGMTEAEVRAAYPAAVEVSPPEEYDRAAAFARLRLPAIQAAGLDFTAHFLFSKTSQRLSMVILKREPENPSEYERLLVALTDKYGAPSR